MFCLVKEKTSNKLIKVSLYFVGSTKEFDSWIVFSFLSKSRFYTDRRRDHE